MKKKGGTLAGIPRASGERNSPTGNGAFSSNQVRHHDHIPLPCLSFAMIYEYILDLNGNYPFHSSYENANARAAISSFRLCRIISQNTPTSS